MINICIPTLSRYDLLKKLINSVEKGSVIPDNYYIIDNGGNLDLEETSRIHIYKPGINLGVAGSWNWFILNVPETRIICNDDISFYKNTLERLTSNLGTEIIAFPAGIDSTDVFSCFIIDDAMVQKVGLFDQTLSPNYGYFEDNDYYRRMVLKGLEYTPIKDCMVRHKGSATLQGMDSKQREDHHRKFKNARSNYLQKWGGQPNSEKFSTIPNRRLQIMQKNLTTLTGVGKTLKDKLSEYGITEIEHIAELGPEFLSKIEGVSKARAKELYEEAISIVGERPAKSDKVLAQEGRLEKIKKLEA